MLPALSEASLPPPNHNPPIGCEWLKKNFQAYSRKILAKPGVSQDPSIRRDLKRTAYPVEFFMVQAISLRLELANLENIVTFVDPRFTTLMLGQALRNRLKNHPFANMDMVAWMLSDLKLHCTKSHRYRAR